MPFLLQIVDENGSVLPPEKEGDIAIKIDAKWPFTFFTRYVVKSKVNFRESQLMPAAWYVFIPTGAGAALKSFGSS